jgi:hypothetical protein
MTMEAVPPKSEQGSGEQAQAQPAEQPKPRGLGGMLGGFAKKAVTKKEEPSSKPQTATIFTSSIEMLKLTTDVAAETMAIPAGFKEAK